MTNAKPIPTFYAAAMRATIDKERVEFFTPEGGAYEWPIYSSCTRHFARSHVQPSSVFDYQTSNIEHRWQDKAVLDDVAKDKSCTWESGDPADYQLERLITLLDRLKFRPLYLPPSVMLDTYAQPRLLFTPARGGRSIYKLKCLSDRYEISILDGVENVIGNSSGLRRLHADINSNCRKMGHFFQYLGGRTSSIPSVLRAIMHTTEDENTMGHKFLSGYARTSPARMSYFEYRTSYGHLFRSMIDESTEAFFGSSESVVSHCAVSETGMHLSLVSNVFSERCTPDKRVVLEDARARALQEVSNDDIRIVAEENRQAHGTTVAPILTFRWTEAPIDERIIDVFQAIKAYKDRIDDLYNQNQEA